MSKNTPEIRINGFEDSWEEQKLLGCIQKITDFRGRTPKKLGMDWSESGYLALSALNVKDGYIDFAQDVHYGDQELYDKWMAGNELHKGQVLFTTEAPMGNVAQVPDNRKYILSQRTIAFDVNKDLITEDFLATVLRTPKVFSDLTALSSGGTAKGVSQKSLAAVDIIIPKDLKEQEQLATYLGGIDYVITLHQQEYDKLVNNKKAILEKMFPKEGFDVPEIRFKGFDEPWKKTKLGDLVNRVVRKNSNNESDLALTISAQYGLVDQITYFNNRVASKDVSNYYLMFNGEFAYNKSSSDGFPYGAVKRLDLYEKGVLSTLYIVFDIKNKEKTNSNFLTVFFDTNRWHKAVSERAAEGARNHGLLNITTDDFFDIDLHVPKTEKEQALIGEYFNNLDGLIFLHQQELEKLKNIKAALLEKMFV